jgi:NADPH-dependent ferric siderophore reductase
MTGTDSGRTPIRREPPRFRRATVRRAEALGPRLQRVTLAGEDLAGFAVTEPAASVRLLLPSPDAELVIPAWNGNEFLMPDGSRPVIRTLTPFRADPAAGELDVCVVLHGSGLASTWAERASAGDEVAVSGPGRGYEVDGRARQFLLAGDETALPALTQVLQALPAAATVAVHVEVADASAHIPMPPHRKVTIEWHELAPGAAPGDAMVGAVAAAEVTPEHRVWVAGEAAAVQRIRKHLFDTVGIARDRTVVRGYWKHGRRGT